MKTYRVRLRTYQVVVKEHTVIVESDSIVGAYLKAPVDFNPEVFQVKVMSAEEEKSNG